MDAPTLTADINAVMNLLNNLATVFPSIAPLQRYATILANVVESPIVMAMLVAAINQLSLSSTASRPLGRFPIIRGIRGCNDDSVYIKEQTL